MILSLLLGMGALPASFGFYSISSLYLILNIFSFPSVPLLLVGYGFGASFVALFAQLGGGIYTKAADVGADLVGKVEQGIPEDDPRNPAVIADLVIVQLLFTSFGRVHTLHIQIDAYVNPVFP